MTETKPSQPSAAKLLEDVVRAAKLNPSEENMESLWRSVFTRKAWYLLPAKAGETTPLVLEDELEGESRFVLPIFTSFRLLDRFAKEYGLAEVGMDVYSLPMTPYDAMLRIREVDSVVSAVTFNMGSGDSFSVTVELLVQYAEFFRVFEFGGRS